ncbi:hypothetical protein [Bdellovibrio sp. HCB209]|uniref:hypothetical protein n=1 Tax=Bdellovibrio sp. HCB209 TaxID=3394354 RepID=UPI0039B3DCF5
MKNILVVLIISALAAVSQAKEQSYTSHCFVQPCKIEGDFDGDGKLDTAELVEGAAKKRGIQIKFSSGKSAVVGAGTKLDKGGDDFIWMTTWQLHKGKIEKSKGAGKAPKAKGDSLLVAEEYVKSAYIYWDGAKLKWYPQEQ